VACPVSDIEVEMATSAYPGRVTSHGVRRVAKCPAIAIAIFAAALTASSLACAADPSADADEPRSRFTYEITPFVGYRLGGSFSVIDTGQSVDLDNNVSYGLAFDVRADDNSSYEFFYDHQSTHMSAPSFPTTSLKVDYLQMGGTLVVNEDLKAKPYIMGGLGATLFTPGQGSADTRFSISLGGGVRVPVSQHFSVRLEGRGYFTFISTDTAFLCNSGGSGAACTVRAHGSSFIQFGLLAGASYSF
jgi:opacity protein-like surface antigen